MFTELAFQSRQALLTQCSWLRSVVCAGLREGRGEQILESGAQIFPDNHGKEVVCFFCIFNFFFIYLFICVMWGDGAQGLVQVRQTLCQ